MQYKGKRYSGKPIQSSHQSVLKGEKVTKDTVEQIK